MTSQQSHYQTIQQDDQQTKSLKNYNKNAKILLFFLATVSIILCVLGIVYIVKYNTAEKQLHNQQTLLEAKKTQLENIGKSYQFQNNNVTEFTITMNQTTANQPIKSLLLRGNTLKKFNMNRISGLKTLCLDDNPLQMFNNNYLTDLQFLSLKIPQELFSFTNNYLPKVIDFQSSTKIITFRANTISIKTLEINVQYFLYNDFEKLNSIKFQYSKYLNISHNNFYELSSMSFKAVPNASSSKILMTNNNFATMKQLNLEDLDQNNHWSFINQNYSSLQILKLSGNNIFIDNFNNNNMNNLSQLSLCANLQSIDNFNNNSFGVLKEFNLSNNLIIKSFTYNQFPSLNILNLTNASLLTIKSNNFESLTYAYLSHNDLKTFNIAPAQNLKYLDISSSNVLIELQDLDLPMLQILIFQKSFFLNRLLKLNTPNLKIIKGGFCNIMAVQQTSAPNLVEVRLEFNKLKDFYVPSRHLKILNLTNNQINAINLQIYPQIQIFQAANNQIRFINYGNLSNLKHLNIRSNNLSSFNTQFGDFYFQNLQTLDISNNLNLERINIHIDKLIFLNASYCAVKTTYLIQSKELKEIDLTGNQISSVLNVLTEKLEILRVTSQIYIFLNNYMPKIQNLEELNFGIISVFSNNTIGYLDDCNMDYRFHFVSASLIEFQNNNLHMKSLYFEDSVTNLKSISNNIFEVCMIIRIVAPNLIQFQNNTILNCDYFQINDTSLASFENNFLLNVTILYLRNSKITNFFKNTIPSLEGLYLSNNLLNDSVVDQIVNMEINGLEAICLENNPIENKELAYKKLKNAYPSAEITI